MKIALAAVAALVAAAPAWSAPLTLDFEAVTSFASVGSFYDGGTDSAGATGPSLHASFGPDALALANDVLGPYFSNAPSPLGVMTPVGPDATLNLFDGFINLSFAYSSLADVANGVQVWSGLDGTGTLLGSFDLVANAQVGCTDSPLCHFDVLSAVFGSTAYSVTFGNAANAAVFDNITVPEPASALLALVALGGLLGARRRG